MWLFIYFFEHMWTSCTCLSWVSIFRCWNRRRFIHVLTKILLLLLPLAPFRLGVWSRWPVHTHTHNIISVYFTMPLIQLVLLILQQTPKATHHAGHRPFFGVLLLALLRRRGGRGRWRALPLLGAARLLVPPLIRRGHLICEGLG